MSEKLYAVFTSVKNFSGRRFDVVFTNGKGMANKRQANVLVKNWKYSCPELDQEAGGQLPVISNQLPDSTALTGGAPKEDAKPQVDAKQLAPANTGNMKAGQPTTAKK